MVKEKFRKHIMLTLVLLLLVVFIAGILFGRASSSKKINDINKFIKENELNTESYLIEQQLIGVLDTENCDLAGTRLESLFNQLASIGQTLVTENIKDKLGEDNYNFLKRKYHLLQIRTYALFKKLSDNCNINAPVILYYYSQDDEGSKQQGMILDELVKNHDFSIFAVEFNYSAELKFLESYYDVKTTPTIIVDYDHKFEGLTEYKDIADQFI